MLSFTNEQEYKAHYKSDLHSYNVKRAMVGLKYVTIEQFEKRKHFQFCEHKSVSAQI